MRAFWAVSVAREILRRDPAPRRRFSSRDGRYSELPRFSCLRRGRVPRRAAVIAAVTAAINNIGENSVLWKKQDVVVNFGTGMRKMHFLFSHNNVQYKLELSYENIRKIELHRPRNETT